MSGDKIRLGCRALALGLLLLTVLGLAGCAQQSSFLHPYGPVAHQQRALFLQVIGWMMIVCLPVFILVPLFAWRYRRTNAKSRYEPDWGFSWGLEIVIWGVPVLIVGILAYLIWSWENDLDPYRPIASDKPPLEIQVIGLDWKWLFVYPEQHIATVGVLGLPTNRPVHFTITADAVMQSFFIPSLGSQIYAMAGMKTQLYLLADRAGSLRGENTQFNGMGFHTQKFDVHAMAEPEFDAWVETIRAEAPRPLDMKSYAVLSQRSTAVEAQQRLGMTSLPPGRLYFTDAAPDFLDRIVSKYRPPYPTGVQPTERHADK
ncbi:cytochrome ubiquinol oxidase subunit II [Aurantimonas sp. VKM B-3413]|uniref:cytochrome ubiquinol oxidase subunit II n=1 Tax=Aurantimonas sp. VKM B-3413 TaxID=2779401 RepID=UPI001E584B10|nr:cytochrome ubiquinol oxidase subunit II [Aurantimonas sp. VKM B-3413]MCB8839007.1 cytochrome ubiquinol oxidase subunit II [Aurantimonas sp. VKM B-3413]